MIHPVAFAPSQDFGDNPTAHLPANHWIIQQFGNYQPDGHTGIDYPCPVGTPVKAAAAGVVRHVGWMGGAYSDNPWWIQPSFAGYVYVVDHGHFIGIYGHCQDGGARVKAGQSVTEGQVLGLSGNTGASTGPHLHFEVLPDKYVLNSHMYGRINPHSLFRGNLSPQGTTVSPISKEPFTVAQFDDLIKQIGVSHKKLNGLILTRGYDQKANQRWHGQTHAKVNALTELVQQLAKGQGVTLDLAAIEAASKAGAAEAIQESTGFTAEDIAAAIPPELAEQVVALIAGKLGAAK